MALTISDREVSFDATNTPRPVPGAVVSVMPAEIPLWVKGTSGHYDEDLSSGRSTQANPIDGSWSLTLPEGTECRPNVDGQGNPVTWQITRSNGDVYAGPIPSAAVLATFGLANPVTLDELLTVVTGTYQWGLVSTGGAAPGPIVVVQGGASNPIGAAGGDLAGSSYPNPVIVAGAVTASKIATGTITDAQVAAANKDGNTATPSLRTLGSGAQQAVAGNDGRLSDARMPLLHATTHEPGGGDVLALDGSQVATGTVAPARLNLSGIIGAGLQVVNNVISAVAATLTTAGILRAPKINALDNGILNDGSNQTTNINALITAVAAGSVLYFPQGSYGIDPNQLNITKSLTIEGAGQAMTFFVPTDTSAAGTGGDLLQLNVGGGTKIFNMTLRDLALMPQTSDRTAGSMLHVGNVGSLHLHRVKIDSSLGHKPYRAIAVDAASDTTCHEVHIASTVDNGIHMLTTGSQTIVEWTMDDSCTIHSCGGYGVYAESNNSEGQPSPGDIEGLHFDGTNFFGNGAGDLYLYGNGAGLKNVHGKGVVFDTSGGTHVTIISTTKRCENFEFTDCWVSTSSNGGHGYAILGGQTVDWRIIGGTVQLNSGHGIYVNAAKRGTIRSVDAPDNSQATTATSYAIYLTGTGAITVAGNKAYNSGKYTNLQNGLFVDSSCSDTDLGPNDLDTNYGTAGGTLPCTIITPTTRLRPWGNITDKTQTIPFMVQGPVASSGQTTLGPKFTIDVSGSFATDAFGIGGVATIGGFPSDSTHIQTSGANKATVGGGKMVNLGADVRPQADLSAATYVVLQCAPPVNNSTGGGGGTSFGIGSYYSIYSQVKTSSIYTGTLGNAHAFHAAAPSVGGGALTNTVGLYVEDMGTAANTFAVQTAGSTPSVFGGQVAVASLSTAGAVSAGSVTAATLTASGTGAKVTASGGGIIDATVLSGPISANTDLLTPADFGSLKAWRYPIDQAAASSSTGTTPFLWLFRIKVEASVSMTNIVLGVNVAGATLANCYAGLYNASGTLIGTTADQSSLWTSAGLKSMALVGGPFALTPGYYYVAVQIGSATTQPQFAATAGSTNGGITNVGVSGATLHAASATGSNGSLPVSITMSSNAALGRTIWAALS